MRKLLLFLFICALQCSTCCIFAQDASVILFEDFESGISETWKQEQVLGDYNWVVESGTLTNPNGAFSGDKRIAFRNNTNQTTGNITRLILPELDLTKVFQPILCFSYAQDKWAGDIDTLKVLYRRTPNSNWVTLRKYDTYSSEWQRDTIRLAAITSTYQIAFEGKDNLGRGIVIDDVEIRSIPNCTQPFNLTASKITGVSARLEWAGSFDALTYKIVLSNKPLTIEELGSQLSTLNCKIYEVDGAEYSLGVDGLLPATEYYFYVQSQCQNEFSDWSDVGIFRTSDMLMLPYVETFDMDYVENTTSSVDGWFCYSSKRGAKPPFVNTHQTKSDRLKYSPDSTTALFFHGALNTETAISKNAYSYACVPEIYVDSVKRLQASFWTINYATDGLVPIANFSKLLVGVMTDPEDINTFVAVDTVVLTSVLEFEEIFVSFENYQDTGKYITFMSYFKDGKNAFVIDNLIIDYIPTTPKANISVALPEADALEVNFVEQSARYEVIVANAKLNTDKIDNKKVIKRQEYTSFPCRVEGLNPWVNYFVYARHLNDADTGAWSNPVTILMPDELDTVPTTISFDINTFDVLSYYNPGKSTYKMCNGLLALSNSSSYPDCSQQFWTEPPKARSPWELAMQAPKAESYQMVIFPELQEPEKVSVSFYATRHLKDTAAFAIGIVSDANNVESFQAIDTIILNQQNSTLNSYISYKYNLGDYDVQGHFFAIKAAYDYCGSSVKVWIDDVRFFEGDGCGEPDNITARVVNDEATISWSDNGASSWNVLVSKKEYSADELDKLSPSDYFVKKSTDNPSIIINGLETGEKTYYYYIQSNCNGTLGVWTLPNSFKTECAKFENVPYSMNFDDEEWVASSYLKGFVVPCLYTTQVEVQGDEPGDVFYYPHLSTASATTGEKSLLLGGSVIEGYSSYIAFPQMRVELNTLQIVFDMKADSIDHVVEVGVMSDPSNIKTFEKVAFVEPTIDWSKNTVKFVDYEGQGQYIAIRTAGTENVNYIDNVMIVSATTGGGGGDVNPNEDSCQSPKQLGASDISKTAATISWNSDVDLCNLVVSSRELTIEERVNAVVGGDILAVEQLSAKTYSLTNLKSNTAYHFYVQSLCSDTTSSAWAVGHFYTNCDVLDTYQMGVENFDYYGVGQGVAPNCYIIGNLIDSASNSYFPYCSDEFANSGSASLKFVSIPAYNGAYAITPEINIDDISRLRVKFYASTGKYFTSQYARDLTVAIVTDPTDLATQTNIKTVKVYPGDALQYEVRFDEYIGDYNDDYGRYVMFSSELFTAATVNTVFIDDVVFDTIPECVSPKVREVENKSDRILLQLYEGTAPYQVKYIVGDYSQAALDAAAIVNVGADGNFEINGLVQNTDCFVMVRSTCGDGYSEWSPAHYFTSAKLTTTTLPYYDSFSQNKNVGEYNNPLDWNTHYTVDDVEGQYKYPYVANDRGEDKVVYLYSDASSETSYMVSPKIDVDNLNKCQISFNYKPDVSSVKSQRAIVVGVVSDVSSKAKIASTFHPIDTIITTGTLQYSQVVVSLASYSSSAKYVALMVNHSLNRAKLTDKNGTYGGCYVDDVLIELIPTCQRPTDFRLQSLGDTYAKFAFSHEGATKYEVKYGVAGFDVDKEGTSLSITEKEFAINGLQPNTEYDFYVRAYCSATDISAWSLCERYTTFEVPVSTFPYDNKFDNENENKLWKFSSFNSQLSTDNKFYINDSLYVSSDNGVSTTYRNKTTKTWAYRTYDMKEGVYTVSFDWKAQGDGADYMRVLLIPALSQFTEGSSDVFNFDGSVVTLSAAKQSYPEDWVDLGRDGRVFNSSVHWSTYSKTFMITPEMAGFYRLVVYWENDDMSSSANNMSAVFDNLFIEKSSCSYPYKFEIEDINSTYLTISWKPVDKTPKSYNVVALLKEGNPDEVESVYVASRTTVTSPIATISNLTSSTDYYIYVQANCDGKEDLSYWSDVYRFTTPCDPKPLGTVFSFELDEGYFLPNYDDGEPNTSYRVPDCFVNGHSNSEEFPYIKDNTVSYPHSYMSGIYQVARTGDYALKLYSNSEEKIGGYMALPLIDGNFDELQVSFWIRPFGAVKGTDNVNSVGLNAVFARKVTVGTMTNPNDPSTFEPLQVVSYPYTTENQEMSSGSFVFDDVEGTNYWRKHSVLLKGAKGKFIAFKNEMYDGKENNQMYIDDVVVDYISDCMTPSSVMIEDATATTARLNATTNGGDMFEVQISLKEDCSEVWRTDTITGFPANITNLLPGQDYYMRVKQICGPTQQSDWSSITNCITAYTTLYSTDLLGTFNINSYTPRHWQRSCGTSAADIFSQAGSAMITDPTLPLGWKVKDNHLAVYVTSAETRETNPYCWIFSSSVELPKGDVTMLLDLALTDDDGIHKPDSTISNKKDKFYVIISENNGRSWEEQNKFAWTNDGAGDFDYNAIPFEGTTYSLDLSKYAGKVVRFAFYSECRSTITSELHIRNVHINASVSNKVESFICETEDYRYDEFVKLSTELQLGENKFVYHKRSDNISVKDTINNINVVVKSMSVKTLDAQICDGDIYTQNNFKSLNRAGVYKQKLVSKEGCDSVVVLNLQVNPISEIVFADTICFGANYVWNSKEYNRSGMYIDTLISAVTGCDSIVTLLLKVKDAPMVEKTIDICSGKSYQFGSRTITESGVYTETFKTAEGCDSIVTLTVNVADNLRSILNEFICTGEVYSGNGFNGIPVAGTYTLPLTSVGGCDSTIVLNLIELKDDTIHVEQNITIDELPYTFASKVYDENTEIGIYTDEIFVEHDSCSSVVVLTLKVEEPVGVDNIELSDLVLYPNPVQAGDMINIEGNFTMEELDGMYVEVYTMLGSCIYSSQFTTLNSQLSIDNRGLYIVRVIAGNGTIYQGKIIVK